MEIVITIAITIIVLRLLWSLIVGVLKKIINKVLSRLKWTKRVKKISRSGVVTGEDYEAYVANRLLEQGFLTSYYLTRTTGDYGADIIGTYKNGVRVCIQCKFWANNVGISAVQEIYAARNMYDCPLAMVVTNSEFTKSAIELAQRTGVILLPRYF